MSNELVIRTPSSFAVKYWGRQVTVCIGRGETANAFSKEKMPYTRGTIIGLKVVQPEIKWVTIKKRL